MRNRDFLFTDSANTSLQIAVNKKDRNPLNSGGRDFVDRTNQNRITPVIRHKPNPRKPLFAAAGKQKRP